MLASVNAPPVLDDVYRDHAQDVARWARQLGGPGVDVEDLVQEVFLVAQRRLPAFRGDAKVSTWLYRTTENLVRNHRRKQRFRRWLGGSAQEVAGHLPTTDAPPTERIERRQAGERLYRVLDRMRERSRTVFILFEIEGASGEEIADRMDAKVGTVWVWLHRAREEFSRCLEAHEAVAGCRRDP